MFNNGDFEIEEFLPDLQYVNSLNFILDMCYENNIHLGDYLVSLL